MGGGGLLKLCAQICFVSHPGWGWKPSRTVSELRETREVISHEENSTSVCVEVGNGREAQQGGARGGQEGETGSWPSGMQSTPGGSTAPPSPATSLVKTACAQWGSCVTHLISASLVPVRALLLAVRLSETEKPKSGEVNPVTPEQSQQLQDQAAMPACTSGKPWEGIRTPGQQGPGASCMSPTRLRVHVPLSLPARHWLGPGASRAS